MFSKLFDIIINVLATLLQIVLIPINTIINNTMPNLSNQITSVASTLVSLFSNLGWAIGLIPNSLKAILVFIIVLEIAKYNIYILTHGLIKIWNVIQKIKFW